MLLKIFKIIWVGISLFALYLTLSLYDGEPFSDVWILLTWMMLILSFPAGFVVSLVHYALAVVFSVTIQTTYFSLAFEWGVYFILGYLQWFIFIPFLYRKLEAIEESEKKNG